MHLDGVNPGHARLARPPHPARLAAIVLNFRTPQTTTVAVRSLLASTRLPDEVIVVDNAAVEASREALLANLGGSVTYLPTTRNLGFSGGMNAGIRHALASGADLALIVNSDASLAADCLGHLEQTLATEPAIGIVGPLIRSRRDATTILSLGLRYSSPSGRMRVRAQPGAAVSGGPAVEQVDAVTGCVMLVRRRVFEAIGGFDEDYFFSFEDLDFCLKAGRAGFASAIVRAAVADHEGSLTIGPTSPRRLYFAARNHLLLGQRMATRRGPFADARRFASIVALNAAHATHAPGGTLLERWGAVWNGTRDYLAGRFGDGPGPAGTQDAGG
jgi:GT2 family glycosyltransferase